VTYKERSVYNRVRIRRDSYPLSEAHRMNDVPKVTYMLSGNTNSIFWFPNPCCFDLIHMQIILKEAIGNL
jgi:hypothetical protein